MQSSGLLLLFSIIANIKFVQHQEFYHSIWIMVIYVTIATNCYNSNWLNSVVTRHIHADTDVFAWSVDILRFLKQNKHIVVDKEKLSTRIICKMSPWYPWIQKINAFIYYISFVVSEKIHNLLCVVLFF